MRAKTTHVIPKNGGWAVKKESSTNRSTSVYSTQKEARQRVRLFSGCPRGRLSSTTAMVPSEHETFTACLKCSSLRARASSEARRSKERFPPSSVSASQATDACHPASAVKTYSSIVRSTTRTSLPFMRFCLRCTNSASQPAVPLKSTTPANCALTKLCGSSGSAPTASTTSRLWAEHRRQPAQVQYAARAWVVSRV